MLRHKNLHKKHKECNVTGNKTSNALDRWLTII